jgi:cysteine desulfurase
MGHAVKKQIYLDHNATTPLSTKVLTRLPEALAFWGNPSSIHWAGQQVKTLLRTARQSLAQGLGVSPLELVFTAGGSESNNTVIKGVFHHFKNSDRTEYITTDIEHPSVIKAFQWIEEQGAKVHFLKVNRSGEIDLARYRQILSSNTALVSVMAANNETGVLFPIREMAKEAHTAGALFHSDCVQMFGKLPLNLKELDLDFASISAHKFYALKGTGVLYSKKGNQVPPLVHGGGQERHRRGGTENTPGIFALGVMAGELSKVSEMAREVAALRDHLEKRVLHEIPNVTVTHGKALRLPNTSSLVLQDVDGETLLMSLDVKGFAVSTGAACSSGSPEPSPVLTAVGLEPKEAQSSLRVSLGWESTPEEIDDFVDVLKATVERLRELQTSERLRELHATELRQTASAAVKEKR